MLVSEVNGFVEDKVPQYDKDVRRKQEKGDHEHLDIVASGAPKEGDFNTNSHLTW